MIDEATGLPALPEGFFFRVHEASYSSSYHYVTIYQKVQKRFLFWTYTADVQHIFTERIYPFLTEDNIRKSARKCLQQWKDWDAAQASNLLGDYPPKKLGA